MNMINNPWYGIFAQEHAREILSKICHSSKIPHALLFTGPEGCGKHFTAVRFAQLLNSDINNPEPDSALSQKIANLSEPYLKYIIPLPRGKNETSENSPMEKLDNDTVELVNEEIAKKIRNPYYRINIPNANNIKINSIREIRKFISLDYSDIRYRVILIEDAHLMNDEAQNALLKNLEEPPEGVIFILTVPDKNSLLSTIISRCWLLNFEPLQESDITAILKLHFGVEHTLALEVAPFAAGSVYRAIEYIEHDFDDLLARTINILRFSLGYKFHSAMKEFSSVLSDSSGYTMALVIRMITVWLNDAQRNRVNYNHYFFQNYIDTIDKFNKRFNRSDILNTINILNNIIISMENNVNLNVVALNIIFELASLRNTDIQ